MKLRGLKSALILAVAVIVVLIWLVPVFWSVQTSIKPSSEIDRYPPVWITQNPTLQHYSTVFSSPVIMPMLTNSLVIATSSMALSALLGAPAAYSFARSAGGRGFRGSSLVFYAILFTYGFPAFVFINPLYMLFRSVGLLDTRPGLILLFTTFSLPLTIWMLNSFFVSIPEDFEEAAMIDGCTRLGALFRVILPVAAPGLAATCVYNFMGAWNNFLFPLIFARSTNAKTLSVSIFEYIVPHATLWGPLMAIATLMTLPPLVFVYLAQRYMIEGLARGGVKF